MATFLGVFPSLNMDLSHAVGNGEEVGLDLLLPNTASPLTSHRKEHFGPAQQQAAAQVVQTENSESSSQRLIQTLRTFSAARS